MKVFISWSGATSNNIAKALAGWLPDVIQGTEVFLSSQDIAKGERNAQSMWDALDGYEFGLSIITADNKRAPWIMFEAGAMMRFMSGRVVPILCNIDRLDISTTPLNSFQCSTLEKAELLEVVKSINDASGATLSDARLARSFERCWSDLEHQLSLIEYKQKPPDDAKQFDQADHFTRIENGMTSIMSMIDSLQKAVSADRSRRNYADRQSQKETPENASFRAFTDKLIRRYGVDLPTERDAFIVRNELMDLAGKARQADEADDGTEN
ncbi:TIR domain-containing protein [Methylobacterium sp. J-092]|uniref:TIR domain-containing protein n=1 Tax=Methylobacterium sp. J-092 TaxID=2836667 RepID=UPI001FBA7F0F|nr:TIR domain-containing protein [Methylobacterium sp. J-092]MCJ2009193.1 toll/interleukin-1 receptor domain-containing protein [Methylobacterium sp. J-092]